MSLYQWFAMFLIDIINNDKSLINILLFAKPLPRGVHPQRTSPCHLALVVGLLASQPPEVFGKHLTTSRDQNSGS